MSIKKTLSDLPNKSVHSSPSAFVTKKRLPLELTNEIYAAVPFWHRRRLVLKLNWDAYWLWAVKIKRNWPKWKKAFDEHLLAYFEYTELAYVHLRRFQSNSSHRELELATNKVDNGLAWFRQAYSISSLDLATRIRRREMRNRLKHSLDQFHSIELLIKIHRQIIARLNIAADGIHPSFRAEALQCILGLQSFMPSLETALKEVKDKIVEMHAIKRQLTLQKRHLSDAIGANGRTT